MYVSVGFRLAMVVCFALLSVMFWRLQVRVFVTASQLDIRDIREKNIPTVSLQYQTQILLLSLPTTKHITLSVKLLLHPLPC